MAKEPRFDESITPRLEAVLTVILGEQELHSLRHVALREPEYTQIQIADLQRDS